MTDLVSINPADGEVVWRGAETAPEAVRAAVTDAGAAFDAWADRPFENRAAILRRYTALLTENKIAIAHTISQEMGKPLWESLGEVAAMIGKVEISITAYTARTGSHTETAAFGRLALRHRAHGVMAVLGPYNFPGHLPNGHIVPALLAGNTVVFKPSEEAPATGARMVDLLHQAGVPSTVVAVVQGGRGVGAALLDADIDGVLFTGSAETGQFLAEKFIKRPEVILALELGGNNPLVVWDTADADAVASIIVQSSFITSGQRCSCARRIILPVGAGGDAVIAAVEALLDRLIIGAWDATPEPFMGPLVSVAVAEKAMAAFAARAALGAQVVRLPVRDGAFVTPGILDITGVLGVPDAEMFAPFIQIVRVADFDAAIRAANDTRFGLSAGLITPDRALWDRFIARIRAGVVNWNRATTGASSALPFGGVGISGNHRPSAAYAADYCAFPIASQEADTVASVLGELKGIRA
jgi:succinylglutamic semialdehyde dehydrogenase